MNKAGILKKALDYIRYLQKENGRLKDENIGLKMAQQQRSKIFLYFTCVNISKSQAVT
jgi:hypothetical protein